MRLNFTKMHGTGNDFVIIDAINQTVDLTPSQIRAIAKRRFGVGCDQLLLVEAASTPEIDFCYRIFNADGNEVEQCGNGARCFAHFVREKALTNKDTIIVETKTGTLELVIQKNNQVTVNMGIPNFIPQQVPFIAEQQAETYPIDINGETLNFSVVSLGNPHAVTLVQDITTAPVASIGPLVESHTRFPKRANVGFMQIIDPNHIKLRVFERGAGETLACGSGACAAVVVGQMLGLLKNSVDVSLMGGELHIHWGGNDQAVMMTGPAATVYEGEIKL